MASPNKIKNVGYGYKPFEMKASGVQYNNSPIEKNYGSPAQRGFADFTGGVGSKEMDGGVGSAFDYASPAKGWFGDKLKKIGGALTDPIGAIRDKLTGGGGGAAAGAAAAQAGAAGAGGGAVAPHGDEAHTGAVPGAVPEKTLEEQNEVASQHRKWKSDRAAGGV